MCLFTITPKKSEKNSKIYNLNLCTHKKLQLLSNISIQITQYKAKVCSTQYHKMELFLVAADSCVSLPACCLLPEIYFYKSSLGHKYLLFAFFNITYYGSFKVSLLVCTNFYLASARFSSCTLRFVTKLDKVQTIHSYIHTISIYILTYRKR